MKLLRKYIILFNIIHFLVIAYIILGLYIEISYEFHNDFEDFVSRLH